jgi:hypothetical protein
MRIYLLVTSHDATALRSGGARLPLEAGRLVWGVSSAARDDQGATDLEELEYEALQDAIFSALQQSAPTRRGVALAGDLPDAALAEASTEGGAFGLRVQGEQTLVIASAHVTELDAARAEADDTDPALLWFDVAELPAALDYAEAPSR